MPLQDFINENLPQIGSLNDEAFLNELQTEINNATGDEISSATFYSLTFLGHLINTASRDPLAQMIQNIMQKEGLDFNHMSHDYTNPDMPISFHPLEAALQKQNFSLVNQIINYPGFNPNASIYPNNNYEHVSSALEYLVDNRPNDNKALNLIDNLIAKGANITAYLLNKATTFSGYNDVLSNAIGQALLNAHAAKEGLVIGQVEAQAKAQPDGADLDLVGENPHQDFNDDFAAL